MRWDTLAEADGTISYTAQIRIKKDGMHVSTSRQTLARKTAAEARVKHRETELSVLGAIECTKKGGVLLKDLVDKYLAKVGHSTRIPVNAWHWENSVS